MHQKQVVHSSLTQKAGRVMRESSYRIDLVSSEDSFFFFLKCVPKNKNVMFVVILP